MRSAADKVPAALKLSHDRRHQGAARDPAQLHELQPAPAADQAGHHPMQSRAGRKLRHLAAMLDDTLCRAIEVCADEAALSALTPELQLRTVVLGHRAAVPVPLG
jgi:hypothetical protein